MYLHAGSSSDKEGAVAGPTGVMVGALWEAEDVDPVAEQRQRAGSA